MRSKLLLLGTASTFLVSFACGCGSASESGSASEENANANANANENAAADEKIGTTESEVAVYRGYPGAAAHRRGYGYGGLANRPGYDPPGYNPYRGNAPGYNPPGTGYGYGVANPPGYNPPGYNPYRGNAPGYNPPGAY